MDPFSATIHNCPYDTKCVHHQDASNSAIDEAYRAGALLPRELTSAKGSDPIEALSIGDQLNNLEKMVDTLGFEPRTR